MRKMKIFESAECTITQTPGAKKDSELMRVHVIINTLRINGIEVERYNIIYDEDPFVKNEIVSSLLDSVGIDGLPIIIVDNEVAMSGRYPSRIEFVKLLGIPRNLLINKNNNFGGCRYL